MSQEKIIQDFIGNIKPEETTSKVAPSATDDKPNPLGGYAVLGAAGIGGLAMARLPGLKFLNRMITKQAPRTPNIRPVTTPDKVEEVLTIQPTRMQRANELVMQDNIIRKNLMDEFEVLKKSTKIKPFSQGGQSDRFGSALFDFIAQNPSKKAMKPDYWINEFKNSNRLSNIKLPNSNIRANVTKEELFDTNIAAFDKEGNLIDGYLKFAKDRNIPVRKEVLLRLVANAPATGIVTKRFQVPNTLIAREEKVLDEANDIIKEIEKNLKGKEIALKNDEGFQKFLNFNEAKMGASLNQPKSNLVNVRDEIIKLREGYNLENSSGSIYKNFKEGMDNTKDFLKRYNDDVGGILTVRANRLDDLSEEMRLLSRQRDMLKNKGTYPRYGQHNEYKVPGAEEYIEDVAHYGKPMPFGRDVKSGEFGAEHFGHLKNQLYHLRYGKRSLEGQPNKKVYSIDEIQADIQQRANEVDPTRSKVKNPFGRYFEFEENNQKLDDLLNEMNMISRKKFSMTDSDMKRFKVLQNEFDEVRKNSLNSDNLEKLRANYSDRSVPFMPMFRRDVYGDHALKNTMKSAAENNVDWVVVNPVERVALKRGDGNKIGNWEFYGNSQGKAGLRNWEASTDKGSTKETNFAMTAVIPERMKALAKQYGTEAKPIQVSLSDPNKQFKVVKKLYSKDKAKKLGIDDATNVEHVGAFDDLAEAQRYASTRSGTEVVQIAAEDPRNYYTAFGIKITPEMKGTPFKLYKKEGGLVVNIFA